MPVKSQFTLKPRHLGFALVFVVTAAIAQESLSKDFLDYLAEFQTDDGEWIDPVELEMMAQTGSNNDAAQTSNELEEKPNE